MTQATDITILLDRSGSMHSMRQQAVDGVNKFIRDVNQDPGTGYWTLLTFDDPASASGAKEEFPHCIFSHKREFEVPLIELTDYQTRGGTALVDAVCLTALKIKDWWLALPDQERPRPLLVIFTDGQENSSREFTSERMRAVLADFQTTCKGDVIYLAANVDAFHTAGQYGFQQKTYNFGDVQFCNTVQTSTGDFQTGAVYASGAQCTRAWKAEGNQSADALLSSAAPDASVQSNVNLPSQ